MEIRKLRPITSMCATAAALSCLFMAAPALALDFTVHSYDLGEKIDVAGHGSVWTAELNVSLETVADEVASFCVDLDTYISRGSYPTVGVYDAASAPAGANAAPSGARDFAWAGHVMMTYGHDVDALAADKGVTRDQAITAVQAAIWDRLYGASIVDASSLSAGARMVFHDIVADHGVADYAKGALIVDLPKNQDQVIAGPSHPVPEPSAALVFGLGTVVAGSFVKRRQR